MKLTVNGTKRELSGEEASLAQLLDEVGLAGQPVLVEHNGAALHPAAQRELVLREGDTVELLRMVAGG